MRPLAESSDGKSRFYWKSIWREKKKNWEIQIGLKLNYSNTGRRTFRPFWDSPRCQLEWNLSHANKNLRSSKFNAMHNSKFQTRHRSEISRCKPTRWGIYHADSKGKKKICGESAERKKSSRHANHFSSPMPTPFWHFARRWVKVDLEISALCSQISSQLLTSKAKDVSTEKTHGSVATGKRISLSFLFINIFLSFCIIRLCRATEISNSNGPDPCVVPHSIVKIAIRLCSSAAVREIAKRRLLRFTSGRLENGDMT